MDAMATIETGDSENCARECSLRKDFECNSFDLCSNTDHYRSKETLVLTFVAILILIVNFCWLPKGLLYAHSSCC